MFREKQYNILCVCVCVKKLYVVLSKVYNNNTLINIHFQAEKNIKYNVLYIIICFFFFLYILIKSIIKLCYLFIITMKNIYKYIIC